MKMMKKKRVMEWSTERLRRSSHEKKKRGLIKER
jgi:hypothetical protein